VVRAAGAGRLCARGARSPAARTPTEDQEPIGARPAWSAGRSTGTLDNMDQTFDQYTPRRAAMAGRYFLIGIVVFGFLVFSILISLDCYFNSWICTLLEIACVPLIVVYLSPAVLKLSGKDQTLTQKQRRGLGIVFFTAFYGYVTIYGLLAVSLFISSKKPLEEDIQLFASGSGRGCRHYYSFYEPNTQRHIAICYNKLSFVPRSGEIVVLRGALGPLGIYFHSIARQK
jgi:hypothetical protein